MIKKEVCADRYDEEGGVGRVTLMKKVVWTDRYDEEGGVGKSL
jgi:hypothetical protein